MEISSVHRPLVHIGEEKYQMLELNKRLESYLGRVKLLEEENQLLRGEIHALQKSQSTKSQKKAQEDALSLARSEVQAAWREKDSAELEVSNLLEEMEELNAQRQKERAAKEEAKRRLAENKKKLEDEWRAQIWLKEQASHLKKEVALQVQVHQEEMTSLKSSKVISQPVLMAPRPSQAINLQGLGEEYSQKAAQAWKEAAEVYQKQIEQLEDSLKQARAHNAQINQEKKMSHLHVQDLAKELESTKVKREFLEKKVAQQKDRQNEQLQHLHAQVGALEAEKVDLGEQIGELLIDRRNLMQMKMALGLEVATYRALLDTESLRVHSQSTSKTSARTVSLLDALSKPQGTHLGPQTTSASCHLSSPPITAPRSITHSKANLMTPARTWTPMQSTLEPPKRVLMTKEKVVSINEETVKLEETPTATSSPSSDSIRCEDAHEKVNYAAPISATEVPPAVDETESISSVKEDLQKVYTGNQSEAEHAEEEALISSAAGHLNSLPQTPESEVSPSLHTEETKGSEDDDDEEEETEMSTEIAQISHAPMFAWQENDTMASEEKDVISELELESESISEKCTQEFRTNTELDLNQFAENFEASPLLCKDENKSEILSKESFDTFCSKEVSEIERELIEKRNDMDKPEEVEDKTDFECIKTEVQEGQYSDPDVQEEEFKIEFKAENRKVTEEDKKEVTEGDVEEKMKEEDLDVMHEHFIISGEAAMAQGSSAPDFDLHMDSEHTEQTAELEMENNDKDHVLVEDHVEEEHLESDDESLNISASWRTDPGEADSYAQENTLADTRPLIHYRSDEETDANTQASHIGVSEPSDSEEERDRHEGGGFMGQNNSKLFGTMEDLSEEPEISHSDDLVIDGSAQMMVGESIDEHHTDHALKQLEENTKEVTLPFFEQTPLHSMDAFSQAQNKSEFSTWMDEEKNDSNLLEKESPEIQRESEDKYEEIDRSEELEDKTEVERSGTELQEEIHCFAEITSEMFIQPVGESLQSESEDIDISLSTVQDETLAEPVESDFGNYKESNQTGEETEKENGQEVLVQEQEESFNLHDWSQTSKTTETQQTLQTGQQSDSEDAFFINNDNIENCDVESIPQIKSEEEAGSLKTQFDNFPQLPDVSEQVLEQTFPTEQQSNTEDAFFIDNDKTEICDVESILQTKSEEEEGSLKTQFDNFPLLSDVSEQVLAEELLQISSTETTHSDPFLFNTEMTKKQFQRAKEEESSYLHDWSETSKDIETQQTLPTEEQSNTDDAFFIDNDNTENCDTKSFPQIKSEEEAGSLKTQFDDFPVLSDVSEQVLAEELFEISSTKTTHSDPFLFQTEMTKEQVCLKEEEESSYLHDWSETSKNIETQHTLPSEEQSNTDDAFSINNDNTENCDIESFPQIKSEEKEAGSLKTQFDNFLQLSDVSQEQELFKISSTETTHSDAFLFKTEMTKEQVCLKEEEETSYLHDWSETSKTIETQQTLPTEQQSNSKIDFFSIDNDNTENCDVESFPQIKSEEEAGSLKTQFDNFPQLPDVSQEQELFEISSTETTHSDAFLFKTEMTKEQVCLKEEEDEQSNLSMLTHADFTDSFSVHSETNSRPDSQTHIANSDLEESNSSEDESPNASQCSQPLTHTAMPTQQLDLDNIVSTSENESPSFAGLLKDAMKEGFEGHHYEDYNEPQAPELENEKELNKKEEQVAVDNTVISDLAENVTGHPQIQEWVDINHPEGGTGASLNIINATEELNDMTRTENDKASDEMNILEGNVMSEESQMKDKENDPHHFFSSGIWSTTKFEMAATNDSDDLNGTERDNIHPHQSMTFEEDWGELGSLKPVNGKTEKETGISTAQSEEEEREEQKMPLVKQQQCRDVRDGQVEGVQSDESIDDGDSWSSGEE